MSTISKVIFLLLLLCFSFNPTSAFEGEKNYMSNLLELRKQKNILAKDIILFRAKNYENKRLYKLFDKVDYFVDTHLPSLDISTMENTLENIENNLQSTLYSYNEVVDYLKLRIKFELLASNINKNLDLSEEKLYINNYEKDSIEDFVKIEGIQGTNAGEQSSKTIKTLDNTEKDIDNTHVTLPKGSKKNMVGRMTVRKEKDVIYYNGVPIPRRGRSTRNIIRPTIELLGEKEITIMLGDSWQDIGAKYIDQKDGEGVIKATSGKVNTQNLGTYKLLYEYKNTSGVTSNAVSRVVHVKEKTAVLHVLVSGNIEIEESLSKEGAYNKCMDYIGTHSHEHDIKCIWNNHEFYPSIDISVGAEQEIPGNGKYHGWPTLTETKSGNLLIAYSGREEHIDGSGKVEVIKSIDRGQTWSKPKIIYDLPVDDRDAGIIELENGKIMVHTFSSYVYLVNNNASATEINEAKKHIYASQIIFNDDAFEEGTKEISKVDFNTPNGPIKLSNGDLFVIGREYKNGQGFGQQILAKISKDNGSTWETISTLPPREGDTIGGYHELDSVEVSPGIIVAHIRNHNTTNDGETLQTTSLDGGKTWSDIISIGTSGYPSDLTKLKNGGILMTYSKRTDNLGIYAKVSYNAGKTWSKEITIINNKKYWDFGYPTTVELSKNEFLTVWYESPGKGKYAVLKQVKWGFQ